MKDFETTSLRESQPLEVMRQVDAACTLFERALRHGDMLKVETLLEDVRTEARQHALRELLTLEMEYRAKSGESPSLELFRQRFPHDLALVKYLYLEHFVPAQLADFSIQRLLGRGAYGHVYQGWDSKLARNVAIKFFRRDPMKPASRGTNLRTEARVVAQLRHPGIVTVYAVQQDDDGAEFLVLEYVDGKSLEELLRIAPPTPVEGIRILLDVVQALQHAHQSGVVHRDLKPANIMLDAALRPRVTDFGLALQVATSGHRPEIAGTISYMAPEQASGETHRLDARTDLWAIGVILYRMLSGTLPFTGSTPQELLEAIRYAEPRELRENDPTISPELARIARRCLAKRMSERYQSAAELADDLGALANCNSDRQLSEGPTVESPIAVVPKGLRHFDTDDREFFLSLVPGPRDRYGVPSAINFWERRLLSLNAHETFRVGLLYGPSGCGKSSLIRAGILPRLARNVKVLFVEGARDETELGLIRELRRRFPELSPEWSLPESLRELREGSFLGPSEKLLVVFDQFEQWLHGWQQGAAAQLVETLRQCDGGRVQSLILVRDDFWMPATRFFQQLDVPLVEGFNASAVDLFDRAHASKVLAAFGVAYGRLNELSWRKDPDALRFLERAVDELVEGGWVVPVRLCIFAEMIKSRPWTTVTLNEVGGAQGLGAAFLDEVFDGRMASPMHRLHRKAARLVLERLLPPPGIEIRGHLSSESELQAVSGYDERPDEFAALLRCLDQELRLITPSDDEDTAIPRRPNGLDDGAPRMYQLTHDFLVTAIRNWLNQSRRRTARGRAELRLAEYADVYAARPATRQLPGWWDWLRFRILTREASWRPVERQIMNQATRRYAIRGVIAIVAALLMGYLVYDRVESVYTDGLVEALATSDSRDVVQAAGRLSNAKRLGKPRLIERLATQTSASEQRTRLLVGLLAVGEPDTEELNKRLLDSDPPLAVALAESLQRFGRLHQLEAALWSRVSNDQTSNGVFLRACVALARLNPDSHQPQWKTVAEDLRTRLLRDIADNPDHFNTWVEALRPVASSLVDPLKQALDDQDLPDSERLLAANILARYLADDSSQLVDLALGSPPQYFQVFANALIPHAKAAQPLLAHELADSIPKDASESEKDRIARRRAYTILLLRQGGDDQILWPDLVHRPDPRLRSFLLQQLLLMPVKPEQWLRRLETEVDPGIRQAMIEVLGGDANLAASASAGANVIDTLLRYYRSDIDSGVHSASEWTLRRLGHSEAVQRTIAELSKLGIQKDFHWYVTPSGMTMIIVQAPGAVSFGSPETEPSRDKSDEAVWTGVIDWSFAISAAEITQAQYVKLVPHFKDYLNENAPKADCPVNLVTWRDALTFCRLLSEQDGFLEAEQAVPARDEWQDALPSIREHTAYRLPLEVEWEVTCRGGTVTPRFFGYAPDLLSSYCCYIANSDGQTRPVGVGLPNPLGAFDMLGNASEWCGDPYLRSRSGNNGQGNSGDLAGSYSAIAVSYAARGNEYGANARTMRTANRNPAPPEMRSFGRGFRIARTMP